MGGRRQIRKAHEGDRRGGAGADRLFLATDPDREGEAISWHVNEVLKSAPRAEGRRRQAGRLQRDHQAARSPRRSASHARSISSWSTPIWPAGRWTTWSASPCRRCCGASCRAAARPGGCSRWRCASSASAKPRSRRSRPREYWTDRGRLPDRGRREIHRPAQPSRRQEARQVSISIAKPRPKPPPTRSSPRPGSRSPRSSAGRRGATRFRRSPPRPCSRRPRASSGFGASRTMRIAQRLYEGIDLGGDTVGLITYMRTDGVAIAGEAIAATRSLIEQRFRRPLSAATARASTSSPAKNAQEAHEAIRPTDLFRQPGDVARYLDNDQRRLYELIWKRTVASQMESAVLDQVDGRHRRRPSGKLQSPRHRLDDRVRRFPHALPGRPRRTSDRDEDEDDDDRRLPPMREKEALERGAVNPSQHFTQPPPRYTEASLVKKLEELGIGRPSTYASIMQVLQDRDYVRIDKRRFVPEDRGRLVTAFLDQLFRALRRIQFHRRPRKPARRHLRRPHRLERGAARFLARVLRRGRRHQGSDHRPGDRRARRGSRPAFLPR